MSRSLEDRLTSLEHGFARVLEHETPDEMHDQLRSHTIELDNLWRVVGLLTGALLITLAVVAWQRARG